MPAIANFFGIVVAMHFDGHPPPHFHARYGRQRVVIEIGTLRVLAGSLPPRALGMVVEWAALHQDDLMANWEAVQRDQPPGAIQPLI